VSVVGSSGSSLGDLAAIDVPRKFRVEKGTGSKAPTSIRTRGYVPHLSPLIKDSSGWVWPAEGTFYRVTTTRERPHSPRTGRSGQPRRRVSLAVQGGPGLDQRHLQGRSNGTSQEVAAQGRAVRPADHDVGMHPGLPAIQRDVADERQHLDLLPDDPPPVEHERAAPVPVIELPDLHDVPPPQARSATASLSRLRRPTRHVTSTPVITVSSASSIIA
jgi:hypothetical protein